jgi:hypothetical protein
VLEGGNDERGGNLTLGGNGQDGDLVVADAQGRQRIYMNGDTGEARFERSDGTITLALDGQNGEIRIKDWSISVPDHVFAEEYRLPPLETLWEFIKANRHLPGVPPANQLTRDGFSLGHLCMVLLEKIEETLLYVMHQDRLLQEQQSRLAQLEAKVGELSQK